jgi:hypothetical protein
MNDDNVKMVPIDDLRFEKRAETLPAELIDRIILIHHTFQPYLSVSLEQTIDNFKYDTHPEQEIALWERMGRTVLTLTYQDSWPEDKIAKVVKVILGLSMGQVQGNELDEEDMQRVIAIWSDRQPG